MSIKTGEGPGGGLAVSPATMTGSAAECRRESAVTSLSFLGGLAADIECLGCFAFFAIHSIGRYTFAEGRPGSVRRPFQAFQAFRVS